MDLADHDDTAVVAVYVESFADGHGLLAAIRVLTEAGKPVLLMTVGASAASQRAARSHTGAITSPLAAVDAACAAAGALRVDTPRQLVEAAALLCARWRPRGLRVGVVGDSGGQGALAADALARSRPAGAAVQRRAGRLVWPRGSRRWRQSATRSTLPAAGSRTSGRTPGPPRRC